MRNDFISNFQNIRGVGCIKFKNKKTGEIITVNRTLINSALVSAQNRNRYYWCNWQVEQPQDRGILLKDILDNAEVDREKSYCLKHQAGNARDYFKKHHTQIAFEPIRIGDIGSTAQAHRVYSCDGKSVTLSANGGGQGGKTGLYLCPTVDDTNNIYIVENGFITIKDKQYPINLPDGFYIIRKLTPVECERLQTLPDDYTRAVSNTQRYKALGNGWTAEVIIHILNSILKDVPNDEEIIVLSMYDGISTGRYCLEKMGFTNIKYYAYEIDPYAIKISKSNYPDIIHKGDAFQIRDQNWSLD